MVSLGRLRFIPLLFGLLFEVTCVIRELKTVTVSGDFLVQQTLPGKFISSTICVLFCNRLDSCSGISIEDPSKCVLLWTSGAAYHSGVGPINALWDADVSYVNGSARFEKISTENPVNLGPISSWRQCHNLCRYAGMRLVAAIFDYDYAMTLQYNKAGGHFYSDGLRAAGDDKFYDSDGKLVWSPELGYSNTFNEENTQPTGLMSKSGQVGDIYSERDYPNDPKRCFCTD